MIISINLRVCPLHSPLTLHPSGFSLFSMQFICLVSSPCPYHFAAEFLSEFDFTAEFDFELDFTYPPASETDTTFGNDDVSINFTVDGTPGQRRPWRRRKRCSNCMYHAESVMSSSCWYRKNLAPGVVCDLIVECATSTRSVRQCSPRRIARRINSCPWGS